MEYLLDTNICIYIIKKKPPEIFEKFKTLTIGDIAISSITVAELQYGIEKSSNSEKNREALEKFLTPIEIIDYGYEASVEYGKIRTELEKKGVPIGPLDMLIASHAKSLDVTLVTNSAHLSPLISQISPLSALLLPTGVDFDNNCCLLSNNIVFLYRTNIIPFDFRKDNITGY